MQPYSAVGETVRRLRPTSSAATHRGPWDEVAPIYFYYPECATVGPPPPRGRRPGKYVWTVDTCQHLRGEGFDCQLTSSIPSERLIASDRDVLPDDLQPSPGQV